MSKTLDSKTLIEKPVKDDSRSYKGGTKHNLFDNRSNLLIFIVVILIILVGIFLIHQIMKNNEKINLAKIHQLILSNDCSNKALNSVNSEKTSFKQLDGSILLLSYRAGCYSNRGQYSTSINNYNQLKSFYEKKGQSNMISNVDQEISINEYNNTHPVTSISKSSPQSEASPALRNHLNTVIKN